jgi:hypothetical protein
MIHPHLELFCLVKGQDAKVFHSLPDFHTSLNCIKKITKCESLTGYTTIDLNSIIPKHMSYKLTAKQLNINYSFFIKNANVLIKFNKISKIDKLIFTEAENHISKQVNGLKKTRKQLNNIDRWSDIINFISNGNNECAYTVFDLSADRMYHFLKFVNNYNASNFKKYFNLKKGECEDNFQEEADEVINLILNIMDKMKGYSKISFKGFGGVAFYVEKLQTNLVHSYFKKAWSTTAVSNHIFSYKGPDIKNEYELPPSIYKYLAYYKIIGDLNKFKNSLQRQILELS